MIMMGFVCKWIDLSIMADSQPGMHLKGIPRVWPLCGEVMTMISIIWWEFTCEQIPDVRPGLPPDWQPPLPPLFPYSHKQIILLLFFKTMAYSLSDPTKNKYIKCQAQSKGANECDSSLTFELKMILKVSEMLIVELVSSMYCALPYYCAPFDINAVSV